MVLDSLKKELNKEQFTFENNKHAEKEKSKLLEKHGFNFETAIKSMKDSAVSTGSEFRFKMASHKIYGGHPFWEKFDEITSNGYKYPIKPIEEKQQKADLKYMMKRGNHKSAHSSESKKNLQKSYNK